MGVDQLVTRRKAEAVLAHTTGSIHPLSHTVMVSGLGITRVPHLQENTPLGPNSRPMHRVLGES